VDSKIFWLQIVSGASLIAYGSLAVFSIFTSVFDIWLAPAIFVLAILTTVAYGATCVLKHTIHPTRSGKYLRCLIR